MEVMKSLMHKLVMNRIRPYYIFQADMAKGTSHFWTPLEKGLEIMRGLHGHTSGLCVPHFVVDLPGGGGKVPLVPDYIAGSEKDTIYIRNYKGDMYSYPLI
jgi:lysine 2,3-aminomutase